LAEKNGVKLVLKGLTSSLEDKMLNEYDNTKTLELLGCPHFMKTAGVPFKSNPPGYVFREKIHPSKVTGSRYFEKESFTYFPLEFLKDEDLGYFGEKTRSDVGDDKAQAVALQIALAYHEAQSAFAGFKHFDFHKSNTRFHTPDEAISGLPDDFKGYCYNALPAGVDVNYKIPASLMTMSINGEDRLVTAKIIDFGESVFGPTAYTNKNFVEAAGNDGILAVARVYILMRGVYLNKNHPKKKHIEAEFDVSKKLEHKKEFLIKLFKHATLLDALKDPALFTAALKSPIDKCTTVTLKATNSLTDSKIVNPGLQQTTVVEPRKVLLDRSSIAVHYDLTLVERGTRVRHRLRQRSKLRAAAKRPISV